MSPTQWGGRKKGSHNVEVFEKMNKAVEARRKKLEEWGADDGFTELFPCIYENQANINEEETDICDFDWREALRMDMAEFYREAKEKFDRGELDLSGYMVAGKDSPDKEITEKDSDYASNKTMEEIFAEYR